MSGGTVNGDLVKQVRTPPQASGRGGGEGMSLSSRGSGIASWRRRYCGFVFA
ncbi:hypothetical protein CLOSYM_03891, partial [[Clostridium] symbiosum ATCC 14940]